MTVSVTKDIHAKWYQEPIVWLIWALLLSVVVACFITIGLAVKSDDGLVAQDYYRDGLSINQSLSASDTAKLMKITALLETEPELISLRLHSARVLATDTVLELQWMHPSNRWLDTVVALPIASASRNGDFYHWQFSPAHAGLHTNWQAHRWHTLISPKPAASYRGAQWRIQGVVPLCCNKSATLQAR